MTIDATRNNTEIGRGIPADTFANRLMLARAQAGHMSVVAAAELCGVGRGAWGNWEKGAQPESFDDLTELIAKRLGCDLEWLRHGGALRPAEPTEARKPRWARGSATAATDIRGRIPNAAPIVPDRPMGRRDQGRPGGNRGPSGPGRATRVRNPLTA